MDRLVNDPAEARSMGSAGRARMVNGHDLAVLIARHEQLYAGLVAGRAPAR
jgi:hypothetical protein